MNRFEKHLTVPVSASELFNWHEREGALERLCPPWDPVTLLHSDGHIRDGAHVKLRAKGPLGIPVTLEVVHEAYREGEHFQDRQVKGPFRSWVHSHLIQADQSDPQAEGPTARLSDSIDYQLPLGILGELGGGKMIRQRLTQLFHYRHSTLAHDLSLHAHAQDKPLHFAISGSSGLIGQPLCALLKTGGHRVTRLTRSPAPDARVWSNPDQAPPLDDVDVVIHLAGEGVAQRWTQATKQKIMESRSMRTAALARELARLKSEGRGPHTLISASGIGYYGHCSHDGEWIDEEHGLGDGFLASVCEAWEKACEPARQAGIRVVNCRIGIVLTPQGGALGKLLTPFSLGAGGPVGHGRQWMSWISLHDVVGALYFCALKQELVGPINLVAPDPVTNKEFAKTLGTVLKRPAILPAPALALKLIFGEMAKETILSGQRVKPSLLLRHHYPFLHTSLEHALRFTLGKVQLNQPS